VSTDEIMPAGARALPYRSNIPKLAEFVFTQIDEEYVARARRAGAHAVVGGANYGQGSSREHAAIAPRYLGLRAVVAVSYARIHWQNLANFGIVPLEFADPSDCERVRPGDVVVVESRDGITAHVRDIELTHRLSPRQVEAVRAGGRIPLFRHG
jgi:aconitate hydratase